MLKGERIYQMQDDYYTLVLYLPTTDEDGVLARWTYGLTEQGKLTDLQLTVVSR